MDQNNQEKLKANQIKKVEKDQNLQKKTKSLQNHLRNLKKDQSLQEKVKKVRNLQKKVKKDQNLPEKAEEENLNLLQKEFGLKKMVYGNISKHLENQIIVLPFQLYKLLHLEVKTCMQILFQDINGGS